MKYVTGTLFVMALAIPLHASAAPGAHETELQDTPWVLVSFVEGGVKSPPVDGTEITLTLPSDEPTAYGKGGCNSYFGSYEVEDDTLSFGPIGSTKMWCGGDDVMQQESRYFQALQAANSYKVTGHRLKISYGEGQGVLVFESAE